jgi:uncharacterized protein YjbJ (UPF0337 family)
MARYRGRRRTTPNEDRLSGFAEKTFGRFKEAGGALTGNRSQQAGGRRRQAAGTLREKKGLLRKLLR